MGAPRSASAQTLHSGRSEPLGCGIEASYLVSVPSCSAAPEACASDGWATCLQAQWTREALENYPFKACFASPITRALESAEDMWQGRDGPLIQLESLREAHLGYLQGMKNDYAQEHHAEVYSALLQTLL